MSTKWCGYESIDVLTNLLEAKASFLYQFGKVITLINNDKKAKLDGEREQWTAISFLINFLIVLIAIFNNWKSLVGGLD